MSWLHSGFKYYERQHFLVRLFFAAVFFSAVIILIQPLQVFPGAFSGLLNSAQRDPKTLPPGVQSFFVATEDGKRLEVWRLEGNGETSTTKPVAVVFHGNAGDVANFFPYQQWLSSIGITSYGFDYRGYGKSSGFPSEEGVFKDGKAVWNFAAKREAVDPAEVIGLGISIGTGPAARTALLYRAKTLVLITPYASLKEVAKATPILGYLAPFLWYSFPTEEYLKQLPGTCLVLAHGKKDTVIPFAQSERLEKAYQEKGKVFFVRSEKAGHNDVFFLTYPEIGNRLAQCLLLHRTTEKN